MIIRDGSIRNEKGQFVSGVSLYKGIKKKIKHDKQFKKGQTAWNKGKRKAVKWLDFSLVTFLEYHRAHQWIFRHYGKAIFCSFNKGHKSTQFEWANISGKYPKDINDYVQLCHKCHYWYDRIRRGGVYQ